jgi:hypothetical protein
MPAAAENKDRAFKFLIVFSPVFRFPFVKQKGQNDLTHYQRAGFHGAGYEFDDAIPRRIARNAAFFCGRNSEDFLSS